MSISLQQTSATGEHAPSRGRTLWFILSVLFTLGNVAGGVIAARNGEFTHAGVHALLVLLGGKVAWWLAPGRYARAPSVRATEALEASYGDLRDRLERIEQSVEAVAIEVERIGEGQRFMSRLYTQNDRDMPDGGNSPERKDAAAGNKEPSWRAT